MSYEMQRQALQTRIRKLKEELRQAELELSQLVKGRQETSSRSTDNYRRYYDDQAASLSDPQLEN